MQFSVDSLLTESQIRYKTPGRSPRSFPCVQNSPHQNCPRHMCICLSLSQKACPGKGISLSPEVWNSFESVHWEVVPVDYRLQHLFLFGPCICICSECWMKLLNLHALLSFTGTFCCRYSQCLLFYPCKIETVRLWTHKASFRWHNFCCGVCAQCVKIYCWLV